MSAHDDVTGIPVDVHVNICCFSLSLSFSFSSIFLSLCISAQILSLYLDCPNAGMLSWPGNGAEKAGTPTLHCPNSSSVTALIAALKSGDIFFHAFPHDGEASTYPDGTLFEAAIEIVERIADSVGIPRPIAVSQRDVRTRNGLLT